MSPTQTWPVALAFLSGTLIACGSTAAGAPSVDAGLPEAVVEASPPADAGGDSVPPDAGPDVNKSVSCATTFGSSLTDAFGRVDGTVLAVVPPNDQSCAMPNRTHLIVEVTMQGAVYRMVVDVLSTVGNPDVFFSELDAPLAAGPWAEGWHPGVALDYVTTLSVHSPAFTEMKQADLVAKITGEIELGAHISVFATSAGEPSSTHLVHRNLPNADGAIVVGPESAQPHYLLLRFAEQTF